MPTTDTAVAPRLTTRRVWLWSHDAMTRQLLGLLLQRLGAEAPLTIEHPARAEEVLHSGEAGLLVVAIDPADGASLQSLRTLAAIRSEHAAAGPQLVALVRSESEGALARDAGADAVLIRPPRLEAVRALLCAPWPAVSTLDVSALRELHRLYGSAGVRDVVTALAADLPMQRARAEAAMAAGDLGTIQQVAHTLRGTGLQLGAHDLATLCTDVENLAAAKAREAAITAAAEMLSAYADFIGQFLHAARTAEFVHSPEHSL